MRKFLVLPVVLAVLSLTVLSQESIKVDNDFVHKQFGKEFTLVSEVGAMTGDLDGDGIEDLVVAARCKNALLDQAQHDYTVIDPYMTFYGYGDPTITLTFGDADPRRKVVEVRIHQRVRRSMIHGQNARERRRQAHVRIGGNVQLARRGIKVGLRVEPLVHRRKEFVAQP